MSEANERRIEIRPILNKNEVDREIKTKKHSVIFEYERCHPQFRILFASLIKSSIAVVCRVDGIIKRRE